MMPMEDQRDEDALSSRIFCIDCTKPLTHDGANQLLDNKFMKCGHCGLKMNLPKVHLRLYEKVPLAKQLGDITNNAVWGNGYTVEENEYSPRIIDFMETNSIDPLIKRIVFDTVVIGRSYIEIYKGKKIRFTRLDPSLLETRTAGSTDLLDLGEDSHQEWQTTQYKLDGSIHRRIDSDNLVVFTAPSGLESPLGESIYGRWLAQWFDIMNPIQPEFVKKSAKESIIMGSLVPPARLNPHLRRKIPTLGQKLSEDLFSDSVSQRRDAIKEDIESRIFPDILEEEFDPGESWPRFVWIP
jgi:hypothetical protein